MFYEEGQEGLTWEQQKEHIAELWAEVHRLARHAEIQQNAADYRARRIAEVDFYLQEESTWEQDTDTVLEKIAGILDIDVSTEKTFEIVVRHTVVVNGKRGADWSEVDSYAFSAPDIEISLSDFEINQSDYEIEEVEEQ